MIQNRKDERSDQNIFKIGESKSALSDNDKSAQNYEDSQDFDENDIINEKLNDLSNIQKSYFTNTSVNNTKTNADVSKQNSSIDAKLKKTINQQLEIGVTQKHLVNNGNVSVPNTNHLIVNNWDVASKHSSSRRSSYNDVKSRDSSFSKNLQYLDNKYNVDKLLQELKYQQSLQKSSNQSNLKQTFKSPLRKVEDSLNYSSTPSNLQAKYSKPSQKPMIASEKSSGRNSNNKYADIYRNNLVRKLFDF